MPAPPAAVASSSIAATMRGAGSRGDARHHAERFGQERIADQDRRALPVHLVARRPPAAEVVVVHRRQVVVDQRIGVDELERARERQGAGRRHARDLAGREREDRADPLAAGEQAVAERLAELRARGRQQATERPLASRRRSSR
jgi:hypothetical protein